MGNAEALARIRNALRQQGAAIARTEAPRKVDLRSPVRVRDESGLLSYQAEPAGRLARTLRVLGCAADASDMGCHAAGTAIMMSDGSVKPVEDVAVGDLLMGDDSTPREVVQLHRGREAMVRVVPVKGEPFVVNQNHILSVQQTNYSAVHKAKAANNGKIFDWSISKIRALPRSYQANLKLFRVGVEFPARHQPIDPYFLGVYLGDGSSAAQWPAISKPDKEIEDLCREQAAEWGGDLHKTGAGTSASWVFRNCRALRTALFHLRLWSLSSPERFIPETYKTGSSEQRRALLAGLLDTDGHKCSNGTYDYISASRQLAEDAAYVARSLGFAAYVTDTVKGCQNGFSGEYYRVSLSGVIGLPMRLPRKQSEHPRGQTKSVLRTGFRLEDLPVDNYYGFSLTGNGRFLLGDFTVTHNTGKTYAGLAAFRELGVAPLIVTPKSVRPGWHRAGAHLGVPPVDVCNWENIRTGRGPHFDGRRFASHVNALVFDEVHRGRNPGTLNSELLIAARRQNIPSLYLSATMAETPLHFEVMGYALGLHTGGENFARWALNFGCRCEPGVGLTFGGSAEALRKLHAEIFPERGVRVRIADLGDSFPSTQIVADAYEANETPEIVAAYEEMEAELADIAARESRDRYAHQFAVMIRAQQKVEMLKVPLLVSMARDAYAEGHRVVIFCNYEESRAALCEKLGTRCTVHGGQTGLRGEQERQDCIDRFQRNEEPVIVVNIKAGGVGTSLHDPLGVVPRTTLVCPTFSATDLRQALGRTRRAGGAHSLQKIIFIAGTIEEQAARSVQRKLANLDTINDGDLYARA